MSPEDLRLRQKQAQKLAEATDTLTLSIRGFYEKAVESGFKEAEALFLTNTYLQEVMRIISQNKT